MDEKIRVGIFGLTCCAGEELNITNLEEELIDIAEIVEIIEKLIKGEGTKEHLSLLERWGKTMMNASICGLGKSAPNMLLSSLKYFRNEWESLVG